MDIKETNELIAHVNEIFEYQILNRTLLESKLFPVTAYICVSFYNSYEMLHDILKKVAAKTTPEEMGKKSRKILSELQALTLNYIPLYYMEGRMGDIYRKGDDPKYESMEKRKETMFVLDFWKRLASSYYQNGKLFVATLDEIKENGGSANIALYDPDVTWSIDQIKDVSQDEAHKIRRTMANLEVLSFLDECEARAKLCDHGPYRINDQEILIFREISHLYAGGKPHFPWSETEAKAPHDNIAFAYRLKNVDAVVDNFATMRTDPVNWGDHVTGAALFTREGDDVFPLGFDVLEPFFDYSNKAMRELYLKFTKWDRKQRLIAGAYAYCYGYARYTNFVGITDEINWDLTEKTMTKYVPEFLETDFDKGITRHFRSKAKKRKEGPSLYYIAED
ncbi:MAG: hypothetical protein EU539_05700 [Promethearchaeota archaeon]|nr:MAG: hypothetical protein EU539_05700 [Candidatus Lokiarchaeota archaeon]